MSIYSSHLYAEIRTLISLYDAEKRKENKDNAHQSQL